MATRTNARERVYRYIAGRKTPVTRAEIVRGTGIKENTVNPRVAELLRDEWVAEVGVRGDRSTLVAL